MSRLLTDSRLRVARACQRKHKIRYVQGFKALVEAAALIFGSLAHVALEAWWRAKQEGLDRMLAVHAMLQVELANGADPFDIVRVFELMRGYDARWGDEQLTVLGVEVPFETELVNPETGKPSRTWRLAGKIDVIVQDVRGRVFIMEHKTSSENISPGSDYYRRLRMNGQISIYIEGARSLGYEVSGCIYDVIGKPGIRPLKVSAKRKTDETPEEFRLRLVDNIAEDPAGYYQRAEVVRLDDEMSEAMWDIWQLGQQMREAEVSGKAPRNPDACISWGSTCQYFGVCTGEASLEDETQFKHVENVHPELAGLVTLNPPKEEATDASPATDSY